MGVHRTHNSDGVWVRDPRRVDDRAFADEVDLHLSIPKDSCCNLQRLSQVVSQSRLASSVAALYASGTATARRSTRARSVSSVIGGRVTF
jgi:hypothetical protein